jgi:plasmid stabilization system protein ParE
MLAPEVELDVDEAYAWYERQRAGLGKDFLTRVDACVQAIRRTPQMHAAVYKHYRRGLVRQFPYAIFYEYANRAVTVYAVMHTARDPKKWRERLP